MGYRSALAPKMAGRDDSSKQREAWNTFFLCESSEKIWKGEIGATGVASSMRARLISRERAAGIHRVVITGAGEIDCAGTTGLRA